ncbi:MAG TPA: ShlB/FhaC/HecB family hemolysin secretion/activation protein, partial [Prochlorococcaceae cyanobacterium Fu_MAG_50]|nr:ShlB/FhaC/HecB family hemolysin secretion/activation protein [Prochlorococcaceae cyanobacterium Fu_MAG_50]
MAPPLQPGPARLPERIPLEARPQQQEPVFETPIFGDPIPQPQAEPLDQERPPAELPNTTWRPQIQGTTPYNASQLREILRNCGRPSVPATLRACAAALTARLVRDGYINSRVYTLLEPLPAHLEVVEGRIAEVRVSSTDQGL